MTAKQSTIPAVVAIVGSMTSGMSNTTIDTSKGPVHYHMPRALVVFGGLGFVVFSYLLACEYGFAWMRVLSRQGEFHLAEKAGLASVAVGCLFLVFLGRIRCTVSAVGIDYHGLFQTRRLEWHTIRRVRVPRRGIGIRIESSEARISTIALVGPNQREFADDLPKYIQRWAPEAVVEVSDRIR